MGGTAHFTRFIPPKGNRASGELLIVSGRITRDMRFSSLHNPIRSNIPLAPSNPLARDGVGPAQCVRKERRRGGSHSHRPTLTSPILKGVTRRVAPSTAAPPDPLFPVAREMKD